MRYGELRAIYKAGYAVDRQEFQNPVGLQSRNREAAEIRWVSAQGNMSIASEHEPGSSNLPPCAPEQTK